MNCCCDRDCLNVNRDVFKNCMEDTGKQEDKYCPTKILNSPLLCVVKDNLYSRHFYPQHQVNFVPSIFVLLLFHDAIEIHILDRRRGLQC